MPSGRQIAGAKLTNRDPLIPSDPAAELGVAKMYFLTSLKLQLNRRPPSEPVGKVDEISTLLKLLANSSLKASLILAASDKTAPVCDLRVIEPLLARLSRLFT